MSAIILKADVVSTHRDEDADLAPAIYGRLWHQEADTAKGDGAVDEYLIWTLCARGNITDSKNLRCCLSIKVSENICKV